MARLARLLFIALLASSGCSAVRAKGSWSGRDDISTLVTAGAMVIGVAIESEPARETLCDENDPPHTCPGTTPPPPAPAPLAR